MKEIPPKNHFVQALIRQACYKQVHYCDKNNKEKKCVLRMSSIYYDVCTNSEELLGVQFQCFKRRG